MKKEWSNDSSFVQAAPDCWVLTDKFRVSTDQLFVRTFLEGLTPGDGILAAAGPEKLLFTYKPPEVPVQRIYN